MYSFFSYATITHWSQKFRMYLRIRADSVDQISPRALTKPAGPLSDELCSRRQDWGVCRGTWLGDPLHTHAWGKKT
jgi:hypothetical protein